MLLSVDPQCPCASIKALSDLLGFEEGLGFVPNVMPAAVAHEGIALVALLTAEGDSGR